MNLGKLSILSLTLALFSTSVFSQVNSGQRERLRQQNRDQQRANRGQVNSTPRRGGNTTYNNGNRHNGNTYGNNRYNTPTRVRTTPTRYNNSPYRAYNHRSYNHNYVQRRQYLRSINYYNHVVRYNRNYVRNNWIFYPQSYSNGYYVIEQYPYFVYNGYRHRYSMSDSCDYQLVDSISNQVVQNFYGMCARSYDNCANERDWKNNYEYSNRYFCAETFRSNY